MQGLIMKAFTNGITRCSSMNKMMVMNKFQFTTMAVVEETKRIKEKQIADLLKSELNASYVKIEDTSVGGSACGQMYRMVVQSPLFNEKSRVEQHQMVTNILSPVFKDVHGYNLKTLVVEEKKEETNTAAAAETSNTTATTKTE